MIGPLPFLYRKRRIELTFFDLLLYQSDPANQKASVRVNGLKRVHNVLVPYSQSGRSLPVTVFSDPLRPPDTAFVQRIAIKMKQGKAFEHRIFRLSGYSLGIFWGAYGCQVIAKQDVFGFRASLLAKPDFAVGLT